MYAKRLCICVKAFSTHIAQLLVVETACIACQLHLHDESDRKNNVLLALSHIPYTHAHFNYYYTSPIWLQERERHWLLAVPMPDADVAFLRFLSYHCVIILKFLCAFNVAFSSSKLFITDFMLSHSIPLGAFIFRRRCVTTTPTPDKEK